MSRLKDIPEVSFMGDVTLPGLKELAINLFKENYEEITGTTTEPTDKEKAMLYATAQMTYQCMEIGNEKARQNLLKYATGDYLINLGAGRVDKIMGECSVVTERFVLSAARPTVVAIPAGTRVTSQERKIYFETKEYTEIPAGETYADILCMATVPGKSGNEFETGELNILADPIPYIQNVSNMEAPSGGADEESDDNYAERIYHARYLYSTAGAEEAYKYYTKTYSSLIDDVKVENPYDAEIEIYILMADRENATDIFIEGLTEYLCNANIRPITDHVTVHNIERVEYEIDVEYSIYDSNVSKVADIQATVSEAISAYKIWQSGKIGRDIDHQELIARLKAVGAVKINIKSPSDTVVGSNQIAYCSNANAEYMGIVEE